MFLCVLLSPAKDGAPPSRLVEWHTWLAPTLDNPPVASSILRRADILQLELGNNKETRRLPVSFHLEGVVSFAPCSVSILFAIVKSCFLRFDSAVYT